MRGIIKRPSPATALATLALFVALGGTSIAAVSALPRKSVGTAQLRANAVISSKVKNGSLLRVDLAKNQIQHGGSVQRDPQARPVPPQSGAGQPQRQLSSQTTERSRCDRPVERPVTHQHPEREEPGTAITSEAARVDERIERRKQAAEAERMIRQARRRRQRRRRAQLAAAALQQLIQPAVKQPACEQVRRFNR
jgi:hypothetical protein